MYKIFVGFRPFCKEIGRDTEIEKRSKIFVILLIQYAIITIFVWIGFSFGWYDNIRDNINDMVFFVVLATIFNGIFSIRYLFYFEYPYSIKCDIVSIIVYVPLMIIYIYSFSMTIEDKYILSFTFILFLDILSIFLFNFFFDTHFGEVFGTCFLTNIVAIILFHFFWLNNVIALLWLLVLSIFTDIYLAIMTYITQDKFEDNYIFSVVSFNYGFFSSIPYSIYLAGKYICKCFELMNLCD